jgi:hypothetical protein
MHNSILILLLPKGCDILKHFCYLIPILLILLLLITPGSQDQSSYGNTGVSQADIHTINVYMKAQGLKEIPLDAATMMSNSQYKNSRTNAIKSDWQFLVDFVHNEKSAKPAHLSSDHTVELGVDSAIAFRINSAVWEKIGT